MPANRYFLSVEFQEGSSVHLEDAEFHHLTRVMRNDEGEDVELVNGKGQLAHARIASIEKKKAYLNILSVVDAKTLETPLILAQAIPRLSKLEFILEKGTELGMTQLWLFSTRHSDKEKFSSAQWQRLNTILVSAMKQSGRLFLPEILLMPPLKQWQKFPLPAFLGDTRPEAPNLTHLYSQVLPNQGCIFCIGPESGFIADEIATLENLGAVGVKLNRNILRTETAAISALSILSNLSLSLDAQP